MKRFLPHITILLCIASFANAQQLTWNKEFVDTSAAQVQGMLGNDSGSFYYTRLHRVDPAKEHKLSITLAPEVTLDRFDFSGNKIYGKRLIVRDKGSKDNYLFEDVFYMRNNILMVQYMPDAHTACIFKIDKQNGVIDNNKVQLGVVDKLIAPPGWKKALWGPYDRTEVYKGCLPDYRYRFIVSNDRSELLSYYQKQGENRVSLKVIKDDLSFGWNKEIEINTKGDSSQIGDGLFVGDKVYMLVKTLIGKDSCSFSILEYDHATDKVSSVITDINKDKYLRDLKWVVDNSGNIVLNGVYAEVKKEGAVGAYFIKIDKGSGKVLVNTIIPFDKNFLSLFDRDISKGISLMVIRKIIVLNDNSIIVAAEQNKNFIEDYLLHYTVKGVKFTLGNSRRYDESFDYYDGIVYKINTDGSMVWAKDIVKRQNMGSSSETAPFSCSYGTYSFNNKVYILFNDQINNKDLTIDQANRNNIRTAVLDGGAAYITPILEAIDISTGEITRRSLTDEKAKLYLYPAFYYPLKDRVIVFRSENYSGKKNNSQFGQLTFQ